MPFSHSYVALFLFSLGLDAGAGAEGEEIEIHGDTLKGTGKCRKMQTANLKFDIRSQGRLRDNVSPPHSDPFARRKWTDSFGVGTVQAKSGKLTQSQNDCTGKSDVASLKHSSVFASWVETYPEWIFLCLTCILLCQEDLDDIWWLCTKNRFDAAIRTETDHLRLKGCKAERWHGNVVEIERLLLQMSGARDTVK